MEAAVSHVKAVGPPSIFRTKISFSCPYIVCFPVQDYQTFLQKQRVERCGQLHKLKCAKEGSVSEVEKQLMMEEEELIGIRKLNDKCKGVSGIVELLECLEREAIMGEDEGREPTDYNRRAQIFDKSSRVFQALKQSTNAH
ncbi:UNVERIFIED_CONTAM: hypothetical protein Slati_4137000 [Sesamum latifolium]|uniref:Uncharacterized protein n=1 Tax=Sesamum latifolium TaxID=2727402 RepID=A0AAW2TBR4_9LAMI